MQRLVGHAYLYTAYSDRTIKRGQRKTEDSVFEPAVRLLPLSKKENGGLRGISPLVLSSAKPMYFAEQ